MLCILSGLYVCTLYVRLVAPGDQKRVLSPLELELQMIVNCHVGAGIQIQVLWKSSSYCYC